MGQTQDKYHYIVFAGERNNKNEYTAIWDLKVSTNEPERATAPEVFVPPLLPQIPTAAASPVPPSPLSVQQQDEIPE